MQPIPLVLALFLSLHADRAAATQIDVTLDPGPAGTLFATKTFDLPELVGVLIEDEPLSVDFRYGPGKFIDSTVFVIGNALATLVITFDPLPPRSQDPGPRVRGFAVDEAGGLVLSAGLSHTYGPSAGPDTSSLTLSLDRHAAQMITIRHFGMHAEWDWTPAEGAVGSVIRSAEITFLDGRRFFPNEPPPHLVGTTVPEPAVFGMLGIGAFGIRRRRRAFPRRRGSVAVGVSDA